MAMEITSKFPVVFIGHGSPINAIEANEFSLAWMKLGQTLQPKAILVISAHWQTDGIKVTSGDHPQQIYDFYGFLDELYQFKYQVSGNVTLAKQTVDLLKPKFMSVLDNKWGIDHGAWSVLCRMFPKANIPVIQLSLDANLKPAEHWQVAEKLSHLRDAGILILGSGNLVHNLGLVKWQADGFDWADKFDQQLQTLIVEGDFEKLINYQNLEDWQLAIPTNEHYLPLLYTLALKGANEKIKFFTEKVTMGSISMRSLIINQCHNMSHDV